MANGWKKTTSHSTWVSHWTAHLHTVSYVEQIKTYKGKNWSEEQHIEEDCQHEVGN